MYGSLGAFCCFFSPDNVLKHYFLNQIFQIKALRSTLLSTQTLHIYFPGPSHPREDVPAGPGPHPVRPDRGAHTEEQPGGDGPPDGGLRRRPIQGGGGAGGVDLQRKTGGIKCRICVGKYVVQVEKIAGVRGAGQQCQWVQRE